VPPSCPLQRGEGSVQIRKNRARKENQAVIQLFLVRGRFDKRETNSLKKKFTTKEKKGKGYGLNKLR